MLYIGLLDAYPDAYDSYMFYTEQLKNAEVFGTTRQVSEWIRVQDWRPNGVISLMGSIYPISGFIGIRIIFLMSVVASTNTVIDCLKKTILSNSSGIFSTLISNAYVLSTAFIYLSIGELYMESIVYGSMATLIWCTFIVVDKPSFNNSKRINILIGTLIGSALIVKLYMVFYVMALILVIAIRVISRTTRTNKTKR